VELVAERGKGDEEERRERRLTAGSQPSAREAKKKEKGKEVGPPRVVLFAGPAGLAGSLAIFRGCRPMKEIRSSDKNFGLKV
jgi:hypothetical protein